MVSIIKVRKIKVRPDNGDESMLLINHSSIKGAFL